MIFPILHRLIQLIIDWDETKGKIEQMLSGPIDPTIIMYLINAIYLRVNGANSSIQKIPLILIFIPMMATLLP